MLNNCEKLSGYLSVFSNYQPLSLGRSSLFADLCSLGDCIGVLACVHTAGAFLNDVQLLQLILMIQNVAENSVECFISFHSPREMIM